MVPDVSVLIVAYNSKKIIDELLQSLLKQTYKNIEVILIDNGSTDGCSDYVMQNYSSVKVIRTQKNFGYTGGANLGMDHAQGKYIFIINDDIILDSRTIEELRSYIERHPSVGAVQPKIRSYFERQRFEYAGAAGGMLDICGYPFCRGRLFYTTENDLGQYDKPTQIFWASGAAFMIRKSVTDRLGLFDELFEFYHEETDLCWRLHLAGYDVAYVPTALIYHRGGHATKKFFPHRQLVNMHRNNFYMLIKNSPLRDLVKILPLRLLLEAFSIFYFLKRGEQKQVIAILKSYIEVLFNLKKLLKKRQKNRNLINNSSKKWKSLIYPRPVIIEYFLLKRLKYYQLRFIPSS